MRALPTALAVLLCASPAAADDGALSSDQQEVVDELVGSAKKRIEELRSEQDALEAQLLDELRHDGRRAKAEKLNRRIAAARQAIDQVRIDLWFDLRDVLGEMQLELLDRRIGLKNLGGQLGKPAATIRKHKLPRLTRSHVKRGINRVRGKVLACATSAKFEGVFKAKIHIAASGAVAAVAVSGASQSLRSCVAKVLKRARFPGAQQGITVSYPFVVR